MIIIYIYFNNELKLRLATFKKNSFVMINKFFIFLVWWKGYFFFLIDYFLFSARFLTYATIVLNECNLTTIQEWIFLKNVHQTESQWQYCFNWVNWLSPREIYETLPELLMYKREASTLPRWYRTLLKMIAQGKKLYVGGY